MSEALTTDQVEAQVSQNADDAISAQNQAAEGIVARFETEMIAVTKEDFLERWYKGGYAEALAEAEMTDRNLVRGALASLRGRVPSQEESADRLTPPSTAPPPRGPGLQIQSVTALKSGW